MRKLLFVPESKRVNVPLKELRAGRNHMAIAVDEYGSVADLVTMEDVIEQIIGAIDDEYDTEDEKNIRREGERIWQVRGATRIGEFNDYFGAQFPDDANDTVAGLVTQHFGRLPRRGETRNARGLRIPRDPRGPAAHRCAARHHAGESVPPDAVTASDQSG